MRKRTAFVVVLLFVSFGLIAHDLQYIDLRSIQNIDLYVDDLKFVSDNREYLGNWVTDNAWKSSYTRAEMVAHIESFYRKVCENPENENQEYLLLKAMLSEYLYHLDETRYFKEVVQNYNNIELLKNHDYRYKWFLGLFYTKAALPFDAIRQYETVLSLVPEDKLHPDFFADYAYSQTLAMMPVSAMKNFERHFAALHVEPDDHVYNSLKKSMIEYKSGTELEFKNVFYTLAREKDEGLFSRLLGLWLVLKPEWAMKYTGLKDNRLLLHLTSEKIKHKSGNVITYSITLISVLDDDGSLAASFKRSLPNLRPVENPISKNGEYFEYSDPATYSHIGGAHGYLAIIRRDYHEGVEEEIEKPARIMAKSSDSSVRYFRLEEDYRRYPGAITHYILLDSCEYIFDQSKQEFLEFLEKADFR